MLLCKLCAASDQAEHAIVQMKTMFKRWLDFEMERGAPAQAQHVQDAAKAYVEQHLA